DEDYAEQFAETMQRFNKGKKFDERKYYHFKLSCARKDNVGAQNAHIFAEELAAILFPDDECVIATHTDTKTVHSHIIVNAVNPITGKKLRITESDYTRMKDEANRLGSEFGYSTIDFRKRAQNKRTTEESHIILKGGTSWKEDLREVIEEAKRSSSTQEEFISHLALYGVTVTRSKTEYSFLHPQKKKAIRGLKLGNNYTKKEIENVIEQNRHGRSGNAARSITETERNEESGLGKLSAERSVGDIKRELQQLNQAAEQARRGNSLGHSGNGIQSDGHDGESGQRDTADSAERTAVQDGNQRQHKKSDYYFGK
ncbi:MAG: relaxase/mobilization nuclease domain-containing protein, partial [Corallococcus sp.]|nr:relaxase/mobilization nuclease domain-containing protein [Corallococcus sp.]